jgi:hypothetical protein
MNKSELEQLLTRSRDTLNALGGVLPVLQPRSRVLLGVFWLFLAVLAYAFGGHGTKFIYVDF